MQTGSTILSWITFTPSIAMLAIGVAMLLRPALRFSKETLDQIARGLALVGAAVPVVLAIQIWRGFDATTTGMQFVHRLSWIKAFNIEYYMGIDGLSVTLILLTALVSFLAVIASMPWGIAADDHHHFSRRSVPGYMVLIMLLETGMLGVFCSLDFFLFYVFWELMLLPMYFLIGIWGGPRREYAAIKFFLYTLAGSVLMLLGMIALYFAGGHTFDLVKLAALASEKALHLPAFFGDNVDSAKIVWTGMFIAFAIKIPMFPFHTWLPDAHVEAPTPISVILAGVLLKMGIYGILRICYPVLPEATQWAQYGMAAFGVINIVYAAFVCMAQRDLKKLIAYSSVSHMGFCLLGMAAFTPQGITGAVYQMFNHGIIASALFLIAGVVYDRAHHREINGFGGLAKPMPEYTAFVGLAFMASLGLPGLNGFISEALVFVGSFRTFTMLTVASALGVVITAAYYLWTLQRMFLGKVNEKYATITDLNWRERLTLYPLAVIMIVLGFYPMPIIDLMNKTLHALVLPLNGGVGL